MQNDLFINGRFLTQRISGVQAFAREICRELMKKTNFVILVPKNAVLYDDEFLDKIKKTGVYSGHLWEQISLPLFVNQHSNAILLNLCNTGPIFLRKQICTVHDLAFLQNQNWFNPIFKYIYSYLIPRLIKSSYAVLTVSKTIKNELIQEYKIEKKKITVVTNKVGQNLFNVNQIKEFDKRLQSNDFFLMVGSNNQRKNSSFVERLFKEQMPNHKLVIVGGSHCSFSNNENLKTDYYNIIKLDYVNDEKLVWLYKNAICLINPSLYEGFGIPNIEAMMFGCPVVCSDIKVFREICKQAAFYFDVNKQDTLKTILTSDIKNKELTELKRKEGEVIFKELQYSERADIILKLLTI
jgi:glycosyltransferase involved in cell wall biosynthesis